MALNLGDLVGYLVIDETPFNQGLVGAQAALNQFAATGEASAGKAGKRIASAAADPLASSGRAAGAAFATDAVNALQAAEGEAEAAGEDAGDGYASSFGDKAKTVGKLAGVAIGGAITAGLIENLDIEAGRNKLAAQLNLSSRDAAVAGKVAASVYRDNFGEDLAQVNDAVRLVVQNIGTDLGAVDIQPITAKVLTLADTFEQDLGMTTAAVGQLMKTGLAKDATEALDIITRGLQSPANKADDLLETFNEYGTQFRKLGLDGPVALGLMSQGLQGGARDADIVADSLKEFSIRTLEAIETMDSKGRPQLTELGQAFQTLGLDGYDMQEKIAAGGPGAQKALGLVLDKLRNVKDPASRAATAVALFGTQAEDMGDALFGLDVDTAAKSIGRVGGAADDVVKKTGSGSQATIDTYKRKILGMGQDALNSVGPLAAVAGAVAAVAPAVLGVLGPIAQLVAARAMQTAAASTAAGAETAASGATVRGWIIASAQAMASAVRIAAAWLISIGPIVLVIAAIAGVVYLVIKYWDQIKAFTKAAWDWVVDKISSVVSSVVGFVRDNWPLLLAIITGPIGLAVLFISRNMDKIKRIMSSAWSAVKGAARAAWNGITGVISNGAQAIVSGVRAIPGKLGALAGKFKSAGRGLIDAFVNGLKNAGGVISGIAGNVWKAVKGLLNTAIGKINAALEFKISIPGPDIHINPPNIPKLAAGGYVDRPTLALIGEAGPEAVVPLSGRNGANARNALGIDARGGDMDDDLKRGTHLVQHITALPDQSPKQIGDAAAERILFVLGNR